MNSEYQQGARTITAIALTCSSYVVLVSAGKWNAVTCFWWTINDIFICNMNPQYWKYFFSRKLCLIYYVKVISAEDVNRKADWMLAGLILIYVVYDLFHHWFSLTIYNRLCIYHYIFCTCCDSEVVMWKIVHWYFITIFANSKIDMEMNLKYESITIIKIRFVLSPGAHFIMI